MYKIGDSLPAVKFEVIEKPNDWAKENKKALLTNTTQQFRYDYWTEFNEYAFKNAKFAKEFSKRKASTDHWYDLSIGSSACHMGLCVIQKRNAISIEFYISDDKELYKNCLKVKRRLK